MDRIEHRARQLWDKGQSSKPEDQRLFWENAGGLAKVTFRARAHRELSRG